MIKRFTLNLLVILLVAGCTNTGQPDVSGIKVELTTRRFDKDFFSLDTTKLVEGLNDLRNKYPAFTDLFLNRILNVDPHWSSDSLTYYVKGFINAYKAVYDSASRVFSDFSPYERELKKAIQHVKFYFPEYAVPHNIITYIGPLDGLGDIISDDAFSVGLQVHLGQNFSLYKSTYVSETYPSYISKRFTPEYISINCIQNIIDDMFPEKLEDKSLVIQMVEKGKRLYLLSKILPEKQEYQLIGYTKSQLEESYKNETIIWDLFIKNDLLQSIDNDVVSHYIGVSPFTRELGERSPGNIGSFTGWQIVKKYMTNSKMSLKELMAEDAETLFEKAKYKP